MKNSFFFPLVYDIAKAASQPLHFVRISKKLTLEGEVHIFGCAKTIFVTILRVSILSLACYSRTSQGLRCFRSSFEKFSLRFFNRTPVPRCPALSASCSQIFHCEFRLVCVVSSSGVTQGQPFLRVEKKEIFISMMDEVHWSVYDILAPGADRFIHYV